MPTRAAEVIIMQQEAAGSALGRRPTASSRSTAMAGVRPALAATIMATASPITPTATITTSDQAGTSSDSG